MRYLTIIIAFFSLNVNAQIIKGRIVDFENNSGIENAHIIIPESFRGTISDSNGFFEISKENYSNNLIVSCVGYKDTVLSINKIEENLISLRKSNIQIEEVSVYGKKWEEKYIGVNKRRPNVVSLSNGKFTQFGWTLYFPNNENGIVKSFGIHILEISNEDIKLNIRFLEPDTTFKTLGFDKLKNEIVFDKLNKGWNEITLDGKKIRISENGLLVKFYFTGMKKNDKISVSGSPKAYDYSWVSSSNYTKDFPLTIGKMDIKPAVRMMILR
jgi:hypothetical protein